MRCYFETQRLLQSRKGHCPASGGQFLLHGKPLAGNTSDYRVCGGILMGLIGGIMNICSLFCRPAAKGKDRSGMGLYGSMNAISMALEPAAGIHLHQMFGYRSAFIAAAVFSAATGIIIQFTSDRGKPPAEIL